MEIIMPLPFILGGIAIAAAATGAKKGYDGYRDKKEATAIIDKVQAAYKEKKTVFDKYEKVSTDSLERLGSLQLKIGADFGEFRRIADKLLSQIESSANHKDITLSIPQHKLDEIKALELSTTTYLSQVVGAGVAGAAAAYAVYGGVMALAAASTGTPIAALSGAAAYKATMAAIGGGSIVSGGFGMAGGAVVLGGVVVAPIIAIAGLAFAKYAEKALEDATKAEKEVDEAIKNMDLAIVQFEDITVYVDKIEALTRSIYNIFQKYFHDLVEINLYIQHGGNPDNIADEALLVIDNGYKVAAILTDLITTPLFKPKKSGDGKVILGENNAAVIEIDENGLQVINKEGIETALDKADSEITRI